MKQTVLEQPFTLPVERQKSNPFRYEAMMGYLFVSPSVILFLCFVLHSIAACDVKSA